jgi:hypothetical protein
MLDAGQNWTVNRVCTYKGHNKGTFIKGTKSGAIRIYEGERRERREREREREEMY